MNIDNNLKKNNEDLQKKTPSILALWAVPRSVSTAFVRMF